MQARRLHANKKRKDRDTLVTQDQSLVFFEECTGGRLEIDPFGGMLNVHLCAHQIEARGEHLTGVQLVKLHKGLEGFWGCGQKAC